MNLILDANAADADESKAPSLAIVQQVSTAGRPALAHTGESASKLAMQQKL